MSNVVSPERRNDDERSADENVPSSVIGNVLETYNRRILSIFLDDDLREAIGQHLALWKDGIIERANSMEFFLTLDVRYNAERNRILDGLKQSLAKAKQAVARTERNLAKLKQREAKLNQKEKELKAWESRLEEASKRLEHRPLAAIPSCLKSIWTRMTQEMIRSSEQEKPKSMENDDSKGTLVGQDGMSEKEHDTDGVATNEDAEQKSFENDDPNRSSVSQDDKSKDENSGDDTH